MITAYDIIKGLVCCDSELSSCNVQVAYTNELPKKNAVIFVNDIVIFNNEGTFTIEIRGNKNKGRSTAVITNAILKYHTIHQELSVDNKIFGISFFFDNIIGLGADQDERTIMRLDVLVRVYEERS